MDKLVQVAWIDGPKYPVCVCVYMYTVRYMCVVICHMYVDMCVYIHTYTVGWHVYGDIYVYICIWYGICMYICV